MIRLTVLLAVALAIAGNAFAAEDKTKEAAAKYESGMAHYHLGEWDAAISDWQEGFRARPMPEFLYNIAQAYRMSKRAEKALQFYQSYLSMRPDAPNADSVREHITQLKKLIAEHTAETTSPPTSALPRPDGAHAEKSSAERPATAPAAEAAPAVPPPATSPTTAASSSNEVVQAAPPRKKRTWIWGVVAGGAVVIAGAVVLGVVLGTASNESHVPAVRF